MRDTFTWTSPTGDTGYIFIARDADDLPTLRIEVGDDHYSGTMDHKMLFELITALALQQCNTETPQTVIDGLDLATFAHRELTRAIAKDKPCHALYQREDHIMRTCELHAGHDGEHIDIRGNR